ncbi:unnamed protein product [Leuciscus chuanchicus]
MRMNRVSPEVIFPLDCWFGSVRLAFSADSSCFVRSPVLGGLFGVVVPFWNIGVDSFRGLQGEHTAKFLWLGAAQRSRGQASPPAHPTNPFMFPNRRPRAAPHSFCSTNACVCLIPET